MSLNGKTDDFELVELLTFGNFADMKIVDTKANIKEIETEISR